jgi:hypothetical protein
VTNLKPGRELDALSEEQQWLVDKVDLLAGALVRLGFRGSLSVLTGKDYGVTSVLGMDVRVLPHLGPNEVIIGFQLPTGSDTTAVDVNSPTI